MYQVIYKSSLDNFDIVCLIATQCAISAESCLFQSSTPSQADMVNPRSMRHGGRELSALPSALLLANTAYPRPIWLIASRFEWQYQNCMTITSKYIHSRNT